MKSSHSTLGRSSDFAEDARHAIQQLRNALGDVVEQLPGGRTMRPAHLADALELDTRLAWKISKIASADDPFLASQYVPGAGGLRIFLRAAARSHVDEQAIQRVNAAFAEYRKVMKAHAGDRDSFDAMLAAHVNVSQSRVDLTHRKAAFKHLSYIWGVQARTQLHTYLIQPSANPDRLDVATIRGFVDLRWIRPNVPWRIARFYTIGLEGRNQDQQREALSPASDAVSATGDLPFMHEFCSKPLPPLRRTPSTRGDEVYQLVESPVGNKGLVTYIFGEVIRLGEPRYREGGYKSLVMFALPRTPCETLVFDILLHRDVIEKPAPTAALFNDLFDRASEGSPDDFDRLPLHERVEELGAGADATRTPDVPSYPEMTRHALKQLGWVEEEFRVFRLRIKYPPIPTAVELSQALPARPGVAEER